jgi:hypothetical protein
MLLRLLPAQVDSALHVSQCHRAANLHERASPELLLTHGRMHALHGPEPRQRRALQAQACAAARLGRCAAARKLLGRWGGVCFGPGHPQVDSTHGFTAGGTPHHVAPRRYCRRRLCLRRLLRGMLRLAAGGGRLHASSARRHRVVVLYAFLVELASCHGPVIPQQLGLALRQAPLLPPPPARKARPARAAGGSSSAAGCSGGR